MRHTILIGLLTGCGWSEARFLTVGLEEWCTASADCEGTYDVDACIDHIRAVDRDGCDYDPSAAAQCIDALDAATCEPLPALGTFAFEPDPACDSIWVDCGPLFPKPVEAGTSPPDPTP